MKGIYGIYCTENRKWYIGQSLNISRRRHSHYYELKRGKHPNRHLQGAWNKYGSSAFEFQVLEETSEDMLGVREIAWIAYFKSMNPKNGFNKTTGGEHPKVSDETKKKLSKALRGRKLSEKEKKRQKANRKMRLNKTPFSPEEQLLRIRLFDQFVPELKNFFF